MDFINIYLTIIIGGLSYILYKGKSIYNNVEHFLGPLKKIASALAAVGEFRY